MKKIPSRVGVLFSGGLDSAALVGHYANKGADVWPVYVQCGLRWEKAELRFAQAFLRKLKSKHVKPITKVKMHLEDAYKSNWSKSGKTPDAASDDREVFLPARNLLLTLKALLALSTKNVHQLALATLKGNPFDDATRVYFRDLEHVLARSFQHSIRLRTPFRGSSKETVIRRYRSLPLEFSLSCINPRRNLHCGACNKCAERQNAFRRAHVRDRTAYAKKPEKLTR